MSRRDAVMRRRRVLSLACEVVFGERAIQWTAAHAVMLRACLPCAAAAAGDVGAMHHELPLDAHAH